MMRNGNGGLKGIHRAGFTAATTAERRCKSHRSVAFPVKCMAHLNDYAVLGLSPFASKSDVKFAFKRLALKYHPDVIRGENITQKHQVFREIKSAYESLMHKFEEEEEQVQTMQEYEYDEWDEWMGYEGGIPATFHSI